MNNFSDTSAQKNSFQKYYDRIILLFTQGFDGMIKNGSNSGIKKMFSYAILFMFSTFLIQGTELSEIKVSALQSYDTVTLSGNTSLESDGTDVYAVGFSGNTVSFCCLKNDVCSSYTFNTSGKVKYVTASGGCVYAVSLQNGNTFIDRYIYGRDTLYNYDMGKINITSSYKCRICNDKIYFSSDDEGSHFECMNIYGEKLFSFNAAMGEATDYISDFSGNNLYLFYQNNVYRADTGSNQIPSHILTTVNLRPNIFVCDGIIFDYGGEIVDISERLSVSTGIVSNKINGGFANGYYCKYDNGTIYGYDKSGNKYQLYKTEFGGNAQMLSQNGNLYILSEQGKLDVINTNELSYPKTKTENNSSSSSSVHRKPTNISNGSSLSNTDNGTQKINNTGSYENNNPQFSINSYNVDENRKIIWDISLGTTIAAFRKNITFNTYSLTFFNSRNTEQTSGKLGTGFKMSVRQQNREYKKYTLSVKGDLTGEGNSNSNDVKLLSRYLMNNAQLSDAQYAAGDVNGDGAVNSLDILKIAKNNL